MPETTEESKDHGKSLLSWEFPEYEQRSRSFGWYVLAVPIAIAMVVWSIVSHNYLFAIFIVIAAALLIFQQRQAPAKLLFTIFEDGIDVHGRHFYAFQDIGSYWIVYEPPEVKRIYFNFKAPVRPRLAVPLEETNPLIVRQTLSRFIREDLEREGEPTVEALARLLNL
ncbi:MAG: hypothetical protein V1778_00540 [bacterium]